MRPGMATGRADRVVGLHFFDPVPVLPLVEVVTTLHTSAEVAADVTDFATRTLGKTVIHSHDRTGFVVNALLVPYLLSAIRMTESGFATATDADRGMEPGCAHPMRPLRLTDLVRVRCRASQEGGKRGGFPPSFVCSRAPGRAARLPSWRGLPSDPWSESVRS